MIAARMKVAQGYHQNIFVHTALKHSHSNYIYVVKKMLFSTRNSTNISG